MLTPRQVVAICYREQVVAKLKRYRQAGARGWLYWLKKYRGTNLDSLNEEPLKVKPEWYRLNTHL